MASKRKLKRDIEYMGADMFADAYNLRQVAKEEDVEKVDQIINKVLSWIDDSILRVGHPNGKDNQQLVKKYYRDLKEKLAKDVETIYNEMAELVEKTKA